MPCRAVPGSRKLVAAGAGRYAYNVNRTIENRMKLKFNIEYNTVSGEELMLNVFTGTDAGDCKPRVYRMSTGDGRHWSCTLENFHSESHPVITYYYSVGSGGRVVRREWILYLHRLEFSVLGAASYEMNDMWMDMPAASWLYSSAFSACVNHARLQSVKPASYGSVVRFVVHAPQLREGERLVITGSHDALGMWDVAKGVPMTEHNVNEWIADLDAAMFSGKALEFKFVAVNGADGSAFMWEKGGNRVFRACLCRPGEVRTYCLRNADFDIAPRRLAGTLVPVFSLRSEKSFGVGDFGDLRKMVDWVARTGQRVLQILPVNDTTTTHTWRDSYPYSCISVFALHPQYVDLSRLPPVADRKVRLQYEVLREELNALPAIDYERVGRAKFDYLRVLYRQEGGKVLSSAAFAVFFSENGSWLVPYARYCSLRDSYGTAEFRLWKEHNRWDESERKALSDPQDDMFRSVAFYYYVQFILYTQLREVHDYAVLQGVVLKGDIPIGVNRNGCDVWQEPEYFNLDGQAGAPPDAFSEKGQNWEFPTYNWQRMLDDGCLWWIRRLRHMSVFFDAYRIDHVLGFFRIWEIPVGAVDARIGHFSPALGLTREEIEAYGLHFREQLFVEPFITENVVAEVFGERAGKVADTYLDHSHSDVYRLKPEYATQRLIYAAFEDSRSADDISVRDGLCSLVSGVLFVRDHKDPLKFHPRISAQFGYAYKALGETDRNAFNRLYDDYYYRRNNQFWYREAMRKLPVITQATHMLACAEDLGMVPECVSWVMDELRILSLELQTMPKQWGDRFADINRFPYRSVCTISTHDTPTMRQWWDEDRERARYYYNVTLGMHGEAPHPMPGWLAREIIARHLACPSMICVIAIQDWMAVDERLRRRDADAERVNVPAYSHHYWRYRMHVNIDDLLTDISFCRNVKDMVVGGGRG